MFKNKKQIFWWITIFQLIKETQTDHLTNLPNRKAFEEDLINRINKLKNNQINSLQLILIDLKNLKKINDNHGMISGDKIIVDMSSRLKSIISESKSRAFRIGGDEFAVLQNEFLHKDYVKMNKFCKAISEIPHYTGWAWRKNDTRILDIETDKIAQDMFNEANHQIMNLKSNTG